MQRTQVKILDTTLRDGQQCPGAAMTMELNFAYAELAAKAGIDVLEAGFPSASELDFQIVNSIAQQLCESKGHTIISALCQLREAQIDKTIEALLPATKKQRARLHTYLPVDPSLMQASLGSYANDKDKILKDLQALIKKAADAELEVEFTPEGYSRQGENFDFTSDAIRVAINGGATIINCPDTIGGAGRMQGAEFFVEKMKQHKAIMDKEFPEKTIIWSMHCHNDFGLALDNSLTGVFSGVATQVEGCINGIGERAGNVSLEQVIMCIKHFGKNFEGGELYTGVGTIQLQTLSDFVAKNMLPRQPHWPITGENAARHTSGGHTNAILNNPLAYQPFDPKEVGNEISFVFGPLSGGNHAKTVIEQQGYVCDDADKARVAQHIKALYSERRKGITDLELLQGYFDYRNPLKIKKIDYARKADQSTLIVDGAIFTETGKIEINYSGEDSALAALHQKIVEFIPDLQIENYQSEGVGKGIRALSHSTITISLNGDGKVYQGSAEEPDIEMSALKALINAVNAAYIEQHYRKSRG